MKASVLLVLAAALFAACVYFFARCGDLFVAKDYLGGILFMFVGFSLVRAGVELSRLAVVGRGRGVP
ncbi:MAG: hypothetical protein ACI9MR_003913 [Myxococcota bacterium]